MKIIFVSLLGIGIVAGALHAHASAPPASATTPGCVFISQIADFKAAVASSSVTTDYLVGVQSQLPLRRALLKNIIACAKADTVELKSQVDGLSLPAGDTSLQQAQQGISEQLNEALGYYSLKMEMVGSLGIKGSQDLASSVKDWRAQVYAPVSQQAFNLILWNRNRDVIQTAQKRLDQVTQTVTSLHLSDDDSLKALFEDAQREFSAAVQLQGGAHDTIVSMGSPADSITEIKATLQHLSKMYQDFFDLSQGVKQGFSK